MTVKALVAGGLAAMLLAGCSETGPRQNVGALSGAILGGVVGNQFGSGSGRVAATIAGVAAGAWLGGAIGQRLDQQATERAQRAEYDALEYGRPGAPVEWQESRYRGEIVPGQRYRVNDYDCRDYTHRIWIDGEPEVARGTACRQPDGTWRPVS
ncbi:glycine zipper 2TM domain-containing protein [Prosthecomicrobium pneumaticum]|uniref:17 kDa surface antigen n=1 Tax=Prosthecomicrobium pneumaticum TaxID=81895 RepID=A0A7W9FP81_9HYPH|nr:glycine zipper 2TM domain-containing protein [Prosthecomicrobium pneumaticum]MBB5754332.1 surface antigen [Prosthecomicrobium pneumaticum]